MGYLNSPMPKRSNLMQFGSTPYLDLSNFTAPPFLRRGHQRSSESANCWKCRNPGEIGRRSCFGLWAVWGLCNKKKGPSPMCSILSFKVKEQIMFFLLVAISQTQKASTELRTHTHTHRTSLDKPVRGRCLSLCLLCDLRLPRGRGGCSRSTAQTQNYSPF